MSLFLPVLLLGLAGPAQAVSAPPDAAATQPAVSSFGSPDQNEQDAPQLRHNLRHFDSMAMPIPGNGNTCFFIRSYYFERRDDLAPEFRGMTTCDPGHHRTQKRVGHERGRLVPASDGNPSSTPK